ncbi:MAG: hypothetical protein H0X63_06645, partial [Flavobacteriales bacterium]|nr:hypothetical protein [Flavobacteriales bacterium]
STGSVSASAGVDGSTDGAAGNDGDAGVGQESSSTAQASASDSGNDSSGGESGGIMGGCDEPPCLKNAVEYDYSGNSISGKMEEDLDYIFNGKDGNIFTRFGEVLLRDINADPETAKEAGVDVATAPLIFVRSINQLNTLVKKNKVPNTIKRFDKGKDINQPFDHVHFKDGGALNRNGVWRHGGRKLNNSEIKFLTENGWKIPK